MPKKINPRLFFLAREQVFRFEVSSLMPSTYHNFFFERQKVDASKIKPVGGKIGDPIITDADGKVSFDYYYDSGLTSDATAVDQAQQKANSVAGNKEVIVAASAIDTLANDFESTVLSYFRSHIRIQVYVVPESDYAEVKQ
jgi:hypothetical protein